MEEKRKSLKPLIYYTLTLLLGILLGFSIFYMLEYTGTTTLLEQEAATESSDTDTEQAKEEEPTPLSTTNTFAGTYVSAELPVGWTIVEYTNNTGSDTLMDGTTYFGLVGMKIFNHSNTEMFYIKAMDGIGGREGCDTVYQFTDSDQAYIDHGNDWTLESGITPTNVIDLTTSTYTEYEVLDWEVRRVGSELYRNMNPNLPGFNPACGMDKILTITNLAYYRDIEGGTTSGNTYSMEISDTVDTTQLEMLDEVLESLSVN